MRILHVATYNRIPEQYETLKAVNRLAKDFGFLIDSVLATEPDHYWQHMKRIWGEGDLIIIEQDIVPTQDHLTKLAQCGFPACTVPYMVNGHWSTGRSVYERSDAYGPTGRINLGELQPVYTEWYTDKLVPVSGLGLVKISKELQDKLPIENYPIPNHHWSYLDTWISAYMNVMLGLEWHTHYPTVTHNHVF